MIKNSLNSLKTYSSLYKSLKSSDINLENMNPFDAFTPKVYSATASEEKDKQYYFAVTNIINPDVLISQGDGRRMASIGQLNQVIYDKTDLLMWDKKKQLNGITNEAFITNLRGFLGERMLAIIMKYTLQEVVKIQQQLHPADELTFDFGVIKEAEKQRGKGYIARFNNDYLLRFKGPYNFVILRKDDSQPEAAYQQEKFGLLSTEIDGLAYLHVGQEMYLLVGESSAKSEFILNAWDKKKHPEQDVKERVFDSLRSLFPHHKLVYFVLAYDELLFDNAFNPQRLRSAPRKIHAELQKQQIETIFAPIPQTIPTLEEIAKEIIDKELTKQ